MPRKNLPSGSLPPFVADILWGVGRIGAKALAAGVGSVMEDVDEFAGEVSRRTKKGRARLRELLKDPPDADADVEVEVELDEDEQ